MKTRKTEGKKMSLFNVAVTQQVFDYVHAKKNIFLCIENIKKKKNLQTLPKKLIRTRKKKQKRADEKLKQLKFSDQPTKEKQQFVFSCVNLDIQDQYVSVIIETRRSEDRKKILFNKFRCRLRLKKSFYIHRLS